jgi:rRNA processing protein Gar1
MGKFNEFSEQQMQVQRGANRIQKLNDKVIRLRNMLSMFT